MNDMELLERAAKASGVTWEGVLRDGGVFVLNGRKWDPINDSAEALDLAGGVGLAVDFSVPGRVQVAGPCGIGLEEYLADHEHSQMKAARYAIVRAAAAIGTSRSD